MALLHHAITGTTILLFDPIQFVQVASILNVSVELTIYLKDPVLNTSPHVTHFHSVTMPLTLPSPEQFGTNIYDLMLSDLNPVIPTLSPSFVLTCDTTHTPKTSNHQRLPITLRKLLEAFPVHQTNVSTKENILHDMLFQLPWMAFQHKSLPFPAFIDINTQMLLQKYAMNCLSLVQK